MEITKNIEIHEAVREADFYWRLSDISIQALNGAHLPAPFHAEGKVTRLEGVFNCQTVVSGGDPKGF